ncbi:MAG: transporter permease protein [Firmicutes bacterium]|nr:transporter permease protein [Bacillota bacterium]
MAGAAATGWRKYFEVARTNLRARWAYLWDQLLSTIHLAFIMFVFVQLWRVTYASASPEAFAGYSLPEVIWYLVGTEAIIISLPRIHSVLESEVKEGDLAVRLNKPYSYLLFHYSAFLGEGLVRLATSLAVGGLTAYLLVGGFAFRWEALPVLLLLYLSTTVLHFFYNSVIGLAAFWVEDVFGGGSAGSGGAALSVYDRGAGPAAREILLGGCGPAGAVAGGVDRGVRSGMQCCVPHGREEGGRQWRVSSSALWRRTSA